ncbi:MAG: glycosyltransferase [Pseudomonadota bacterium]
MNAKDLSNVTIVVAARNEEAHIKACIDSLLIAAEGRAEVWVVDDGSSDGSRKILESYDTKIRILSGEGQGPARARNEAAAVSVRTWIAFTDADCVVSPDWLKQLLIGLERAPATVVSVGGRQALSPAAGAVERQIVSFFETVGFVSDYLHTSSDLRSVLHNPTCNVLYERSRLTEAGGFDEMLWPCEDLELDLRMRDQGFEALFTPKAVVEHRRPETWNGLWRMMTRYGFGHAQLIKKRGFCQRIHLLPVVVPTAGAVFFLLVVSKPWVGLALLLAGLAFLVGYFKVRSKSLRSAFVFTSLTLASIFFWLLGFYSGIAGGRRIARKDE